VRIPAADSLLAAYLGDLRIRRLSRASEAQARTVLPRLFSHLREEGVPDPRRVTEEHLVRFAGTLAQLSLSTRCSYLAAVRAFYSFLERTGGILRRPELPVPWARRLPRAVISAVRARRLVSAPCARSARGQRDRAILELLYGTGIRVGECERLDLTDLDLAEGTLLIRDGKGKKDRLVPVAGRAAAALDLYLREGRPGIERGRGSGALFLARGGRRLGLQSIERLVKRLGATPHGLRHACATHLLRGGASVRHVQALLGHRSITTTALYTRVETRDLRMVLERAHPRERTWPR
jgi:site-specific recombinase XerD